jgi:hypothetical protein
MIDDRWNRIFGSVITRANVPIASDSFGRGSKSRV